MREFKTSEAERASARIRSRLWYKMNKERKKEISAKYKARDPDLYAAKSREYTAAWRKRNPDKAVEWRKNNRERDRENSRAWRAKNRDKIAEYQDRYCKKNPELVRAKSRKWRERNPGYNAEAWQRWYRENKHRSVAKDMRRKAAKLRATPAWADHELIELVYAEARQRGLCVDHIIPLRGKNVCGLHVHYNLQLLSHSVNASKGNRLTIPT